MRAFNGENFTKHNHGHADGFYASSSYKFAKEKKISIKNNIFFEFPKLVFKNQQRKHENFVKHFMVLQVVRTINSTFMKFTLQK